MNKITRNFKETLKYLFLRYAMIPIILVFGLFSIFMLVALRINVINNTKEAGKNITSSLDEVYTNYYEQTKEMSKSTAVKNLINTRLDSNLVFDEFYKFNNSQEVKSVFHVVDNKGVFLATTTPSDSDIERFIIRNIIPRIKEKPEEVLSQRDSLNYPYNRRTVYTFGKAIVNESSQIIGFIIFQLYEEDMQQLIIVQDNEITVVTDDYNSIIATNNNSVKGLMNKFNPKYYHKEKYVQLGKGNYYINKSSLSIAPVYVYTLNSISIKSIIFILYFLFILIVSTVLWFLINHLAERMSSKNTESIDKLIHSVNELQNGKMDSYVDINSGDEFEVLGHQYNKMLDELNELITKNEELSNLRRISEIKQLQSQFNPHFIFNVLETLRYSVLITPKDAEKIIIGLSRLLRYSVNYEGQKVLLKKDLDYIEDYLELNKFRFNNRLEYTIDIREEMKEALVPKLLLQAIIENSIKYAYKDKDTLIIEIKGNIIEGKLILEVKDNGSGIEEEQLQDIRKILSEPQNSSEHIGLYNVHRRLVLLYGENYGITINSTYGKGTDVKITIPYEAGDFNV